jgi:energy-coupling factor transporter ATP-binding protein EcfA2
VSDTAATSVPEKKRGRLVVLSGPSGVGKSSVVRLVRAALPELVFSVSVTTRSPRPGEVDGQDYHFVSAEEFDRMIADGELLEWASIHGGLQRSGTPAAAVDAALARCCSSSIWPVRVPFGCPSRKLCWCSWHRRRGKTWSLVWSVERRRRAPPPSAGWKRQGWNWRHRTSSTRSLSIPMSTIRANSWYPCWSVGRRSVTADHFHGARGPDQLVRSTNDAISGDHQ